MIGGQKPTVTRVIAWGLLIVATQLTAGCAARFSPDTIRDEIERQRGQDPLSVFEVPEEDRPAMDVTQISIESGG